MPTKVAPVLSELQSLWSQTFNLVDQIEDMASSDSELPGGFLRYMKVSRSSISN